MKSRKTLPVKWSWAVVAVAAVMWTHALLILLQRMEWK
jgi:hypothetical protein